ncbi:hypothetical protein D3C81_1927130 [compost metagenome]
MLHQSGRDIPPVVRDGFAIQQKQHSLQVRQLITSPAPVQAESPPVIRHQIVDDDLLTKAAWAIGFVIPRQAFEDIDDTTFKNIHFVEM